MKLANLALIFIAVLFIVVLKDSYAQDSDILENEIVIDSFGFRMVYIPTGTVQMGIDVNEFSEIVENGNLGDLSAESTISIQESYGVFETYETTVQGFWLDIYELTVNQYETLVLDSGCVQADICSNSQIPQLLSWDEAVRFCASRGSRLLTETEWEYAANGSENLPFPWGNQLEVNLSAVSMGSELYDVGTQPQNMSWSGIYDMAGNAEEWTNTLYQPYYPNDTTSLTNWYEVNPEFWRVVRGGAQEDSIFFRTTYARQGSFYGVAGVRCARYSNPSPE